MIEKFEEHSYQPMSDKLNEIIDVLNEQEPKKANEFTLGDYYGFQESKPEQQEQPEKSCETCGSCNFEYKFCESEKVTCLQDIDDCTQNNYNNWQPKEPAATVIHEFELYNKTISKFEPVKIVQKYGRVYLIDKTGNEVITGGEMQFSLYAEK